MTVAITCAVLALVCTLYAVALHQLRRRYEPNWTWVTVVIGDAFILGALLAIELAGTPLTALTALAVMASAGAPIIIWQLWLHATRHGRNGGGGHA